MAPKILKGLDFAWGQEYKFFSSKKPCRGDEETVLQLSWMTQIIGFIILRQLSSMLFVSFLPSTLTMILVLGLILTEAFFSNIEASTRQSLMLLVEDDEIRQSIFSMKPLKAPGVDGYPAVFY